MARAPSEEPEGIVYRPELLSVEEAAELAGHGPEELAEFLAQRYPPGATIGWHRDAPAFDTVVFSGEARRSWEHSIPPTKGRRYSIAFRTLRNRE